MTRSTTKIDLVSGVLALVMLLILALGCKKDDQTSNPSGTAVDTIAVPPGWTLAWHDEFNGPIIDQTKWNFEVNGNGGGNNELQYYTSRLQNAYIDSGMLVIQALKENYLGKAYTSARLNTNGRGDWKYGRFEARMLLPYGAGLWPAFWLLPTDWVYGGWPMSGEIDVMEELGDNPAKVYGTIHYGSSTSDHQQSGGWYTLPQGSFAGSFHRFAIEWDSTGMRWYVDGLQYYAVNHGKPFDQRFHLLLNVAVGGNWPGPPDLATTFPQKMKVDYVRVFTKIP
jgi:beta-glucanase (GH16 family)